VGNVEEDGPDWLEGIVRLGSRVQLQGRGADVDPERDKAAEVDAADIAVAAAERSRVPEIDRRPVLEGRNYL
jgi:hypothetical protein